jgi:ATP-binding cassette, subfamily B, bacterial
MHSPLRRYSAFFLRYVRPLRRQLALLALLIFASIALQLVNPQLIRYFIDAAMAAESGPVQTSDLLWAGAIFLAAALLLQGVSVAATYVGEDIGWRATNQLRGDLALHCLQLDLGFHHDHTPGEMIERLDGDIIDIAVFFAQFVVRVFGNLLLLIGVILVLLREDWRVSLALGIYTVVSLISFYYMRKIAVPHWEATRQSAADLFGFLEEQLSGTEDVRSSGAVPYAMRNLFRLAKARLVREIKSGDMDILFIAMWFTLYTVGQIIAFGSGYWLFAQGAITVGTVYLIVYYTDRILQPLNDITNQFQNVQKAAAGINRAEALFAVTSKISDTGDGQLPTGPLTVQFEDVTFGYAADEPVLRSVSFAVQKGRVLGLLGRTGSGKTTITRLLFRLYEPTGGRICLGASEAQDIRHLSLTALRGAIGMVTQEVQLFRATVRENLTLFDSTIGDEQILAVIDQLGLHEWFARLPNGLDTEVAAEGSSLSAGEAQLLAFTRVFLHNPGLIILDEASSRLDPATERLIEQAVDKLLEARTGIIIAHRLATVQRADDILILQDGQIVEYGPREQLAADPGSRFAQLLQTGMEEVLA